MVLRIGHRGAAGTHPENTLSAFRRAVELGADGIELDIHRTADGHLVVLHDPFLGRTASGEGLVRDLTLEQIKQADAGSWKGSQFAGERVPTLREVLRETPSSLRLFIELKAGSLHYPGIEPELISLLAGEGAMERSQVSSFDHHGLKRLHDLEPGLELGLLFADNPLDPVSMAHACGARALHPYWQWISPEMVQAARIAGLEVNVWTVNEPPHMMLMKSLGVDGIMSDYPDRI